MRFTFGEEVCHPPYHWNPSKDEQKGPAEFPGRVTASHFESAWEHLSRLTWRSAGRAVTHATHDNESRLSHLLSPPFHSDVRVNPSHSVCAVIFQLCAPQPTTLILRSPRHPSLLTSVLVSRGHPPLPLKKRRPSRSPSPLLLYRTVRKRLHLLPFHCRRTQFPLGLGDATLLRRASPNRDFSQ